MSNNHRWVRVPSLSVLSQLLAEKAVIVEVCPTHSHHNFKAQDAESFKDVVGYTQTEVRLIDPASFIQYKKVSTITYNTLLDLKDTQEGIVIAANVYTHSYSNLQLLNQLRFDLSTLYGFYLLQETKMGETFGKITKPEDIPADGIIYNTSGAARKVFEHPKEEYQVSKAESFSLVNTDVTFQQLQKQYVLKVQQPVWHPLCYNIADEKALDEVIQHIEQTFVSNSGITPDEYFDEINKDHL